MALFGNSLPSWDPAFPFDGGGQHPAQEEGSVAQARPGSLRSGPDSRPREHPRPPPPTKRGLEEGSVWRLEIGSLRGAHIEIGALSLATQLAGEVGGSRDLELSSPQPAGIPLLLFRIRGTRSS